MTCKNSAFVNQYAFYTGTFLRSVTLVIADTTAAPVLYIVGQ